VSHLEPLTADAAPGVTVIDTGMTGQRELNAVYLIAAAEPCLVEAGPGADADAVVAALGELGIDPHDLAHIALTHVHIDHAGAAGELLRRFPRATVWVHELGAPHLVDPTRLLASTARTYGEERMRRFYGATLPCPADRLRVVVDGGEIDLGDRRLHVVDTPGHASHHVALHESAGGAMFTGEAIGSHLPWADCYRPAMPPPEADVERALDSIRRMRERRPSTLLTSHFGPIPDAEEGFDRGAERISSWSAAVRAVLEADPAVEGDRLESLLRAQAREEYERDSGSPFDLGRYDAIGSIRMNADGLARYWRKRWEREASALS
jgi:glyoxylase-like metal-dependent hydrolase (beta-lactamase superfamily II)